MAAERADHLGRAHRGPACALPTPTQDTLAAFIAIIDEPALAAGAPGRRRLRRPASTTARSRASRSASRTSSPPRTPRPRRTAGSSTAPGASATTPPSSRSCARPAPSSSASSALHEYALGWPDPDTGFRIPKNPWNLDAARPGGSSSGTGAAVGGGVILGGLGTDTGGSIRGPAAFCGISGIKQTFGRVSKEGCVPLGYSLDHIGPMARTARDCAIMLQIMAGYDPPDLCSVDVPVPDMLGLMDGSLAGVRIGVPRDYFFTVPNLDPEVKAAVEAALDAMAAAGATLVDVAHPARRRRPARPARSRCSPRRTPTTSPT